MEVHQLSPFLPNTESCETTAQPVYGCTCGGCLSQWQHGHLKRRVYVYRNGSTAISNHMAKAVTYHEQSHIV